MCRFKSFIYTHIQKKLKTSLSSLYVPFEIFKSALFFIIDKVKTLYEVILGGETRLNGDWAKPSEIASIAYKLDDNVFIIASTSARHLKMVKIHVTGVSTFDWIAAKLHYDVGNYPEKCKNQASFSEDCFKGRSIGEKYYNVHLVAKPKESKRKKRTISRVTYIRDK